MYLDLANSVIRSYKIQDLKSRLLEPALTSHYQVWVPATSSVLDWISLRRQARPGPGDGINLGPLANENLSISCCEASLPGSTFYTHDVNVYSGVTEKFAYARSYDDRSDFTFYVSNQYSQLTYFEDWMSYIADEQYTNVRRARGGVEADDYSYRMNFPYTYRNNIYISKFERSFGGLKTENRNNNATLTYVFKDAYPISMNSIPVAYDSSELLKCTVSFTYSRYYLTSNPLGKITPNPSSQPSPDQLEPPGVQPARSGQSQPASQNNYGDDFFGLA